MPDPDFQLTAELFFPSEDSPSLDVQEVLTLLESHISTVTVDFERGRQQVLANIDRLKSLGTPEIIYRGEYQLMDRTIYVEIPVPERPEILAGYTSGFSYYDGCLGLECQPFDMEALKRGAIFVAQSLELDLSLMNSDYLEIGILFKPGQVTPPELIAERYADLVSISAVRSVTTDWQSRLETACVNWLNTHPTEQTAQRWRSVVTDEQSLAQSLIHRLISMGTVREASVIDFDREFWHHCLALDYDDGSGLVNLSGHPKPLFDL
ncbi:hypothetical protein Pan241w_29290 [Gimesia alba]|uniref:Uncharacterized protein n=1 Tax=Gimesia alba TaxID=2527973 RepID=A0A517RG48_9PLAN|nr:hypothetical protein [Gimesia alba]QDT42840.1 hypothetical protein Pan241w_29290 [Gimesia alba]